MPPAEFGLEDHDADAIVAEPLKGAGMDAKSVTTEP
jgi:hypothetical protein